MIDNYNLSLQNEEENQDIIFIDYYQDKKWKTYYWFKIYNKESKQDFFIERRFSDFENMIENVNRFYPYIIMPKLISDNNEDYSQWAYFLIRFLEQLQNNKSYTQISFIKNFLTQEIYLHKNANNQSFFGSIKNKVSEFIINSSKKVISKYVQQNWEFQDMNLQEEFANQNSLINQIKEKTDLINQCKKKIQQIKNYIKKTSLANQDLNLTIQKSFQYIQVFSKNQSQIIELQNCINKIESILHQDWQQVKIIEKKYFQINFYFQNMQNLLDENQRYFQHLKQFEQDLHEQFQIQEAYYYIKEQYQLKIEEYKQFNIQLKSLFNFFNSEFDLYKKETKNAVLEYMEFQWKIWE